MSNQWQARRGTTAQNDAFTGASGEITYDTDSQGLRVHDGTKQGGYLVDTVVDFQKPTAENNYTWYRLYASGWVEQGGISTNDETPTVLPVAMSDTNYTCVVSALYNSTTLASASVMAKTTTSITINRTDSSTNSSWQVSGMAA